MKKKLLFIALLTASTSLWAADQTDQNVMTGDTQTSTQVPVTEHQSDALNSDVSTTEGESSDKVMTDQATTESGMPETAHQEDVLDKDKQKQRTADSNSTDGATDSEMPTTEHQADALTGNVETTDETTEAAAMTEAEDQSAVPETEHQEEVLDDSKSSDSTSN